MTGADKKNYEKEHLKIVRKYAPECMVLLKSDGSFPLEKSDKIALYGNGAKRTLKGGRGSADVNVKHCPTIWEGLLHAGFEITTEEWIAAYEGERKKAEQKFRSWLREKIEKDGFGMLMENLSIVMPEPEYEIPLQGEGNIAVYVLSRLCGEGVDRQSVPGDFYLTETEIRDILQLERQYEKFMLVLNTGCIVDLSPVADEVSNILLLSQTGSTIGDSFADVLLGKAYPSGKLAATWAAGEAYCTIGEFGGHNDTRYREGIYVGYRYFDTVGKKVLFPFGYGLGYTTFDIRVKEIKYSDSRAEITVTVTNTGEKKGKEVVELYVSVPEGKLDQPYQILAAFEKTKELDLGEAEELTIYCNLRELASTDSERHVRILEKGSYRFYVGNSSRNTKPAGSILLTEDVITEKIHAVGGETDFSDWKPEEKEKRQPDEGKERRYSVQTDGSEITQAVYRKPEIEREAFNFVEKLSDEELVYLCTGEFVGEGSKSIIGDAAITVVGAAGETTGRFKNRGVPNLVMADGPSGLRLCQKYGVDEKGAFPIESEEENLMEIDNKLELLPEKMLETLSVMFPAAMEQEQRTGEVFEQNCTAIPVATAIAQSFNVKAAEELARLVAEEMQHFGIQIWLAPALNIQRNPLCGRTFEYYSEDPIVSGKMAAAITRGVQSIPGCCVTIKHFICNNQERNRFRTSSVVNERALRDIYAKGFEIAVKEAQPYALMSSYNLLNGVHTSERYDLLEILLREEWSYEGMVMSDFLPGDKSSPDEQNRYRKFASAESIKAGNDLMMPGGKAHYENILAALKGEEEGCHLTRAEVERCAARNVMLAWKLCGKDREKSDTKIKTE